MEVEVIEFYLFYHDAEKLNTRGSLHVYIPSLKMHMRGCPVWIKKNYLLVRFPQNKSIGLDGGDVLFPTVQFEDKEYQEELHTALKKAAQAYIMPKIPLLPTIEKPMSKKRGN